MLLKEEISEDKGRVSCLYESTTIYKSVYLFEQRTLYIYFKSGKVYSYQNLGEELHDNFKLSSSQGVFFNKEIKNNNTLYIRKEHSLYDFEINDLKTEINSLLEDRK